MIDLEVARKVAVNSAQPYKVFNLLTGCYAGEFNFNKEPAVITLQTATSWADLTRIKEILVLQSLDLSSKVTSNEPIRRTKTVRRNPTFRVEDL